MTAVTDQVISDPMSREDLLRALDEQSAPLGYEPGQFLEAVRAGAVPDTAQTSGLLVLASIVL